MKQKANARNGKKTGDRSDVGLFIPLPTELASQFPPLGKEDNSPPHATFLFVGSVPHADEDFFLSILAGVIGGLKGPVQAELSREVEYFVQPAKARRVAVLPLRFSHDLAGLRWKLRSALQDAEFDVEDGFPLVYRPHVTLEYLTKLNESYKGVVPQGGWILNGIEVWGLPAVHNISFGDGNNPLAQRIARRFLVG